MQILHEKNDQCYSIYHFGGEGAGGERVKASAVSVMFYFF